MKNPLFKQKPIKLRKGLKNLALEAKLLEKRRLYLSLSDGAEVKLDVDYRKYKDIKKRKVEVTINVKTDACAQSVHIPVSHLQLKKTALVLNDWHVGSGVDIISGGKAVETFTLPASKGKRKNKFDHDAYLSIDLTAKNHPFTDVDVDSKKKKSLAARIRVHSSIKGERQILTPICKK